MGSEEDSDDVDDADELLWMLVETASEEKLVLPASVDELYADERLGMLLEADCK